MTESNDPTKPEPTEPVESPQPTPEQPEPAEPTAPEPGEISDPEPVQEVPDAWDEQRAAQEGVPAPVSEPEHDPATTDPSGSQGAPERSQEQQEPPTR
jgi:hypothetical protein